MGMLTIAGSGENAVGVDQLHMRDKLVVTEAITFDVVRVRVMAETDFLVAIRSQNERLIFGRTDEGDVQ